MEKIYLQDLAEGLMARKGIDKKLADSFLHNAFEIIEEYLLHEQVVKVKGLGTFKLVTVGSRESVNVNTGERIMIESHGKVSFTPDKTLSDRVNKPFADFETVILHEETKTEDMERIESFVQPSPESLDETISPISEEERLVPPHCEESLMGGTTAEVLLIEDTDATEIPVEEPNAENSLSEESEIEICTETATSVNEFQIERAVVEDLVNNPIENIAEESREEESQETTGEKADEEPSVIEQESQEKPLKAGDVENTDPTVERDSKWWLWLLLTILIGTSLYFFIHRKGVGTDGETNEVEEVVDEIIEEDIAEEEHVTPAYSQEQIEELIAENPQVKYGKYWIVGTKAIHVMQKGDDLSKLALEHYGDKHLINYIIKYNKFRDPSKILVGAEVKLPELIEKE